MTVEAVFTGVLRNWRLRKVDDSRDVSGLILAAIAPLVGTHLISLAPPVVFDSDGDGDLDVFCNVESGATSSFLIRNDLAAGGATVIAGLPSIFGATRIRAGDVDLDGDLDLVVGAGYFAHPGPPPPPNFILLNQGGNVFAAPVPLDAPATPTQTMDLELADVDGDGDLDVIEANAAFVFGLSPSSRLLLNNGAGIFTPTTTFAGQFEEAVEVADLDGDADHDVILGTTMYANNGFGVFTSVGTLPTFAGPGTLPASPQALTVRDFDGDAVLDVLVQGLVSSTPFGTRFMKGLSPFTFGTAQLVDSGWGTTVLAEHLVADIDRDGDLDAMLGTAVYACARRQLVLTGVARVGRPFHMDMFAPAGAGYALFASLGRANTSVPPFGQLLIDPLTAVQLSTGTIPVSGFGRTTLPVPNIPALVGITVYWQAFSVADAHLSNLIATTILP